MKQRKENVVIKPHAKAKVVTANDVRALEAKVFPAGPDTNVVLQDKNTMDKNKRLAEVQKQLFDSFNSFFRLFAHFRAGIPMNRAK